MTKSMRGVRWFTGLVPLLLLGSGSGSASGEGWSPNGRWFAFVSRAAGDASAIPADWLLGGSASVTPEKAGVPRTESGRFRLWVLQLESGSSVLLDEHTGPISTPAWRPDGTALAYGKLVVDPAGQSRYEVIVQEAPQRQRVLFSRPVTSWTSEGDDPALKGIAWSPDGRHLAVPLPSPAGLAILRASDGRLLKRIEDGETPAWSPDGHLLAYFAQGTKGGLWVLDDHFGPARLLALVTPVGLAPLWTRDNQSLIVVIRGSRQVDLGRVSLETGQIELVRKLTNRPLAETDSFRSVTLTADPDFENLFVSLDLKDEPHAISWIRPQRNEVVWNLNPFDITVPIRNLEVSPTGGKLALRLGASGAQGAVAILDVETRSLTPVVPEETDRDRWVHLIWNTVDRILRSGLPPPRRETRKVSRPTVLPVPGEIPSNSEPFLALLRMARLGRPLCDRDRTAEPSSDPGLGAFRLGLDYILGHYDACLTELENLEAQAETRDHRLRLLGLRAQIALAQGKRYEARAILEALRAGEPRHRARVENSLPGVFQVIEESDSPERWLDDLLERAGNEPVEPSEVLLQGNPDNPQFELPLRQQPLPVDPFNRIDIVPPGPRFEER